MPGAVKYIIDERGEKTSVLVPVKMWDELNNNYQKLQNKLAVLVSLKEGLAEVRSAKKSNRKLQTLKDFLR